MIKALFVALLATFALVGRVAPAHAEGPGTTSVRSANVAIAKLLKQKVAAGSEAEKKLAAQVTTSVRNFLDIDELGKLAMQDQWAKMSPAQQTEFLASLRALIEESYIKGLRANLDYKVVYESEAAEGANLIVRTKVKAKRKGRPITISVDYVMVKGASGYRCFDVKTDGVGLVANYRAMFNKIVAKDGIDGLLAKMKKKLGA